MRYLLARGHKVASLDIADFDYPERDRVTIYKGDIRDRAAVDQAMQREKSAARENRMKQAEGER